MSLKSVVCRKLLPSHPPKLEATRTTADPQSGAFVGGRRRTTCSGGGPTDLRALYKATAGFPSSSLIMSCACDTERAAQMAPQGTAAMGCTAPQREPHGKQGGPRKGT